MAAVMQNHVCAKQTMASEGNPDSPPELTQKQQRDRSLVKMLVGLRWRLSAVNREGFRDLTKALDPNYVVPSRAELKALRDALYEKPKQKHPTWESSSSDSD